MSDQVQFEEERSNAPRLAVSGGGEPRGMIGYLIRKGVVTTESEANLVLIIFIALLIVVGWIAYRISSPSPAPRVDQAKVDQAMAKYIHASQN